MLPRFGAPKKADPLSLTGGLTSVFDFLCSNLPRTGNRSGLRACNNKNFAADHTLNLPTHVSVVCKVGLTTVMEGNQAERPRKIIAVAFLRGTFKASGLQVFSVKENRLVAPAF